MALVTVTLTNDNEQNVPINVGSTSSWTAMTRINLLDDMMRNFPCEQTADCDDGVAAPLTSFLAGIKVKKMKTVRIRRLVITAEEEIVVAGHQIVGNRITWMAERSNLGWEGRGGGIVSVPGASNDPPRNGGTRRGENRCYL